MKCTIPEISWHNRDPVLSVDIQHNDESNFYRLATGGTDTHVVIWQLSILDNGGVAVEMLSDLTRHNRAVNAVRFSPNGQLLASSDDEAAIILWKKTENHSDIFDDESAKDNKENWTIHKMLRSHIEDIYDLCWSSCSQFLVSGSVDNSAIMWDVTKGKFISILKDHKGFVQGVAWDPKGQFVATLSSDRCLRIISINTKKTVHRVSKSPLPSSTSEENKSTRLFYDDTLKSFCRRLAFSPDGNLLVAPSGIIESEDGKFINVCHVFVRTALSRPVLCLPTNDKFTVAVRFCPKLFEIRQIHSQRENSEFEEACYMEMFDLPYRMVFAVATQNAVLLYDTQQPIPFAKVSNIHYTRLSDICWSSDGRILLVSSTDGYCSLISFNENELGFPYTKTTPSDVESPGVGDYPSKLEKMEDSFMDAAKKTTEDVKIKESESFERKSNASNENLFEVSTIGKYKIDNEISLVCHEIDSVKKEATLIPPSMIKRKPGKRVELITLSTTVNPNPVSSTEDQIQNEDSKDMTDNQVELKSKAPKSILPQPKTPRRVSLITLSSPKSKNGSG